MYVIRQFARFASKSFRSLGFYTYVTFDPGITGRRGDDYFFVNFYVEFRFQRSGVKGGLVDGKRW